MKQKYYCCQAIVKQLKFALITILLDYDPGLFSRHFYSRKLQCVQ